MNKEFTIEELKVLKEGLLKIKHDCVFGTVHDDYLGICANLQSIIPLSYSTNLAYRFIESYSRDWKYNLNKSVSYPVPKTPHLWEGKGKFYRLHLLNYLIDRVNKELAKIINELPSYNIFIGDESNAEYIANRYCKGIHASNDTPMEEGAVYHTVLKTSSGYLVTNRYDPRVVEWCKINNVVPEKL